MSAPQQTIGHYRIVSKLGEGGMGEVWRATDTRLNREVAIKVLPEAFAADPMRMGRFAREAQVLASLNHPGIAAIYGVEERALVMELVEGPTLAEKIPRSGMPIEDAWPIATQIAEALEYAHEKGVVHRDLKPANIKITPEGRVKILDFGLAKALQAEISGESSPSASAEAATLSSPATMAGTILGTAAYMSPEQARDQNVDRRADIWAFGVVLYEMLTGERPFGGPTISDALAAVLAREPDLGKPPAAARPVIEGCLRKDPRHRWRDIGDVRLALAGELPRPAPAAAVTARTPWRWAWIAPGVAALAAASALAGWRLRSAPAEPVTQFTIALPPSETIVPSGGALALSPDGGTIAFSSAAVGGPRRILLRHLDQHGVAPLPGTELAASPIFSPDGRWLAFRQGEALLRVYVAGGEPIPICSPCTGGVWAPDGMIYMAQPGGLMRVPATGGTPQRLRDAQAGPGGPHGFAVELLPDGDHLLYPTIGRPHGFGDDSAIMAQSLRTGAVKMLLQGGTEPHYLSIASARGYLLYAHGGELMAAPFDARRLTITGAAFPAVSDVHQGDGGYAPFLVAANGTLVYISGGEMGQLQKITPQWVGRTESATPILPNADAYSYPALSPDGQSAALTLQNGTQSEIWILNLARQALTRLTFTKPGQVASRPVWTPDGKRVVYALWGNGYSLAEQAANGSGVATVLFSQPFPLAPQCVTPDGQTLLFYDVAHGNSEIWRLPLNAAGKLAPLIQEPFNVVAAQISSDGRWLAYQSDDSGHGEVYVRPYPDLAGKWQISNGGGREPRWSRDGRQLFFRGPDHLMAVDIDTRNGFAAGPPHALFDDQYGDDEISGVFDLPSYDVAPDGQRFFMLKSDASDSVKFQLHVVLHWDRELQRLDPNRPH